MTFTPNGRGIAVVGALGWGGERPLGLVETPKLAKIDYLPIPETMSGSLRKPVISANGDTLATTDQGGNVFLYDLREKRGSGVVRLDGSSVADIAFRNDGRLFAAVSVGDNIVALDFSTEALVRRACTLAGRELSKMEWNAFTTGLELQSVCKTVKPQARHGSAVVHGRDKGKEQLTAFPHPLGVR